ncbi:MAG TPA: tol-pal system protein YbgF [Thiobacillus sp.]|jgi:tol-pal system protein YbgF|nr:tol-pal system protein YbgF [Thiobacillus sp.]
MRRYALILVGTFALAPSAWAVSNDELARQVQALQQLTGELDGRLGRLEAATQQSPQLLGLLNEIEMLKAEIAKLRGLADVQNHQMDTLGKRQNDLYADLDQRIADIAKAVPPAPDVGATQPAAQAAPAQPATPPAAAAGDPPQADPQAESSSYEAALKQFREANYAGAIADFNGFLKAYPASTLASNAQYWIGYSYYALKDYKTALAHQQKLLAAYPASAKVPDALLNIATNQLALDNPDGARKTLEGLVAQYPGTPAATLAARRLATLK